MKPKCDYCCARVSKNQRRLHLRHGLNFCDVSCLIEYVEATHEFMLKIVDDQEKRIKELETKT